MKTMTAFVGDSSFHQVIHYPAGEQQVRLRPQVVEDVKGATVTLVFDVIPTAENVITLCLLLDALDHAQVLAVLLIMPYLPYGRADRPFCPGDCNGLKTFLALIGIASPPKFLIRTLDAHNVKAAKAVTCETLHSVEPTQFIEQAIRDFSERCGTRNVVVLYPDEGAYARYPILSAVGNNHNAIQVETRQAAKERDPESGALLGFNVPEIPAGSAVLIVDDICDGGGTFLGIAEKLTNHKLGLYVTHGIFSKGIADLAKAFPFGIYTTDSFPRGAELKGELKEYQCLPVLMGAAGILPTSRRPVQR